ncbi:macrophage mannose receptor 1-like [Phthorimaea operculella]|nr:macrophage mannose receptor 1-like [Phthorimaea operculella]
MKLMLRILLVTFVVLCVSFPVRAKTENGPFPCGYNYNSDVRGWFKLHDIGATVKQAKHVCNTEGAVLASPTNDVMKNAMISLMHQVQLNKDVHTGIQTTGQMRTNMKYQHEQGDSIALSDNGQLERISQYFELPYICYRNASLHSELNECGTTDSEYTLSKQTDKCYKFHRNRKTFYDAAETCVAEGGHLAIINSQTEADVIREIFDNNPAETIPGNHWSDTAYLGYYASVVVLQPRQRNSDNRANRVVRRLGAQRGRRTRVVSTWVTVEEQPLSEVGYSAWSEDEPNNSSGDEFCITVGRNGRLFDDPCTRHLPFICEKRTDNCIVPTAVHNITSVVMLSENERDKLIYSI